MIKGIAYNFSHITFPFRLRGKLLPLWSWQTPGTLKKHPHHCSALAIPPSTSASGQFSALDYQNATRTFKISLLFGRFTTNLDSAPICLLVVVVGKEGSGAKKALRMIIKREKIDTRKVQKSKALGLKLSDSRCITLNKHEQVAQREN